MRSLFLSQQKQGWSGRQLAIKWPTETEAARDLTRPRPRVGLMDACSLGRRLGRGTDLERVTKLSHSEERLEKQGGEYWSVGVLNSRQIQRLKATAPPHHSSPRRPFLVLLLPPS